MSISSVDYHCLNHLWSIISESTDCKRSASMGLGTWEFMPVHSQQRHWPLASRFAYKRLRSSTELTNSATGAWSSTATDWKGDSGNDFAILYPSLQLCQKHRIHPRRSAFSTAGILLYSLFSPDTVPDLPSRSQPESVLSNPRRQHPRSRPPVFL